MKDSKRGYIAVPDEKKSHFDVSSTSSQISKHEVPWYEDAIEEKKFWKKGVLRFLPWVLHLLFFSGSVCAGLLASKFSTPSEIGTSWDPDPQEFFFNSFEDIILGKRRERFNVRFHGDFNDRSSPFKGPASLKADEAWDTILPCMSISRTLTKWYGDVYWIF